MKVFDADIYRRPMRYFGFGHPSELPIESISQKGKLHVESSEHSVKTVAGLRAIGINGRPIWIRNDRWKWIEISHIDEHIEHRLIRKRMITDYDYEYRSFRDGGVVFKEIGSILRIGTPILRDNPPPIFMKSFLKPLIIFHMIKEALRMLSLSFSQLGFDQKWKVIWKFWKAALRTRKLHILLMWK